MSAGDEAGERGGMGEVYRKLPPAKLRAGSQESKVRKLGGKIRATSGIEGMVDKSNGYDDVAEKFIAARNPDVGVAIVREWVKSLPAGASVLDLGCGHGEPVARILTERGCEIFAVDASPRLLVEFRKRFPAAITENAAVEESELFGREFDGTIAWGLLFLLTAETQELVLRKAAQALRTGGKLLFTAPREAVQWKDTMTGRESLSLGREEYQRILEAEGLMLQEERKDEGENHYYFASKERRASL
jgi:SAM-dependent methyltransferase